MLIRCIGNLPEDTGGGEALSGLRPDVYVVARPQPPPPCWGARAATGATIRLKSACGPGLPWMGTCWATSSFSRAMFLNSATAFGLTFGRVPPAAGGL